MHDYRKCKVSVNGRIGRTARLSERLRSYVTSNPASPATRRGATPTTSPTWPRSRSRVQCGSEQRGHSRHLAYSSDFSQWVALVNNIPTLTFSTQRAHSGRSSTTADPGSISLKFRHARKGSPGLQACSVSQGDYGRIRKP